MLFLNFHAISHILNWTQRIERERKAKEAEDKRLAKIGERKSWHKPLDRKREPKAALQSNDVKELPPDDDEEIIRRRGKKNEVFYMLHFLY